MGNRFRCDYCGRFISIESFEKGEAKVSNWLEGVTPGVEYECFESYHVACIPHPHRSMEEGKEMMERAKELLEKLDECSGETKKITIIFPDWRVQKVEMEDYENARIHVKLAKYDEDGRPRTKDIMLYSNEASKTKPWDYSQFIKHLRNKQYPATKTN